MALIGNRSVLLKSPGRFLAGGPVCVMRSAFNMHGMMRNAYQAYDPLSAIPDGHLSPSAWVLPKTGGGMSSYNMARVAFATAGAGAMGVPIGGDASFAITFANAAGQLISSGTGTASFSFTTAAEIQAVLNGIGSASFTLSTNSAQLLALGWVEGTAGMAYAATLTAYARGNMIGTTVDNTTLTADVIASQVWNSLAASYTATGTMGNKLNSAASGGVDYGSMADAVRTELQSELLRIVELAKVHGLVVGTDLVVTPTSRTAGDVVQSIETTGTETTVSRT